MEDMRAFVRVEIPKYYTEHGIAYKNIGGKVVPYVAQTDEWEYTVDTFREAIEIDMEPVKFEGPLEVKFVFKLGGKSDEPYADMDYPDLTRLSRAFLQALFWDDILKPDQISYMALEKVNADPQGVLVRIRELCHG